MEENMSIIQINNLRSDLSITESRERCVYRNGCTKARVYNSSFVSLIFINLIYSFGWQSQPWLGEAQKVIILHAGFFFLSSWCDAQEGGRQSPRGLCSLTSQWNCPLWVCCRECCLSLSRFANVPTKDQRGRYALGNPTFLGRRPALDSCVEWQMDVPKASLRERRHQCNTGLGRLGSL